MTRLRRTELIRSIEKQTGSRVLVYMTGDRTGLESKISSDVIPFLHEHLRGIGNVPKISLLIYTTGGVTISGYGIVNMIREYCDEYGMIIPSKCLSTGTLMALGANSIIMSKMGLLGPVDPSLTHPLGPQQRAGDPQFPETVPVNVEDVVSFFDLAKREAKTESEDELAKVLGILAGGIHPLVLGAVNRSRNEIRFLIRTLLRQHTDDNEKIDSITRTLLEERFSHNYLIGRREAKDDLGLNITDVPDVLTEDVMALFGEYEQLLQLNSPYNLETELGGKDRVVATLHRSLLEDAEMTHVFSTKVEIDRIRTADPATGAANIRYQSRTLLEQWMRNDGI